MEGGRKARTLAALWSHKAPPAATKEDTVDVEVVVVDVEEEQGGVGPAKGPEEVQTVAGNKRKHVHGDVHEKNKVSEKPKREDRHETKTVTDSTGSPHTCVAGQQGGGG